MVVVDYRDEVVLGMEMLTCGDTQFHLASRTVSLQGMEIPMRSVDTEVCQRVSLTTEAVVRAGFRKIVEGRMVCQADRGP